MSSRYATGPSQLILDSKSIRSLTRTLSDFQDCSEASFAAVVEEGGSTVAHTHNDEFSRRDEIAALAIGAFSAVSALGRLLGDPASQTLFQQGSQHHFLIHAVTPGFFLLTVFGNNTKLGLVRSALTKTLPNLRTQIEDILANQEVSCTLFTQEPAEGDLTLTDHFSLRPE